MQGLFPELPLDNSSQQELKTNWQNAMLKKGFLLEQKEAEVLLKNKEELPDPEDNSKEENLILNIYQKDPRKV